MEEKKNWEKMKEIWRVIVFFFVACVVVLAFAIYFAVMFDDWVKCQATVLLCLGSRWEVAKFIILGAFVVVMVLFGAIGIGRRVVRIKNDGMKKVKIFWEEAKAIAQVVRKILVIGFLFLVGAVGLGLFALIIAVLFDACIECWAKIVLGTDDIKKRDVIEFIGWGIAGVLAFFGAIAINKRADAESENNELIEKGHIDERFKAAVEHLGNQEESVRIASFYEFSYLVRDNKKLQKHIFDILRAHLRRITTKPDYKVTVSKDERTTEEVQCLLDVLFKSKDSQEEFIFAGLKPTLLGVFLNRANLYKSYLRGATLKNMELQNANLYKADLREVLLQEVNLQYANLQKAKLQDADMPGVDMQYANLQGADLQDAALPHAKLQYANLWEANLQKADLQHADLRNAILWRANLQNATLLYAVLEETILQGAKLQGAMLKDANLQGANLQSADLQKADLQNADLQGADLRDADLRGVKNLDTAKLSGAKVKGAIPPKGFQWLGDVDYD